MPSHPAMTGAELHVPGYIQEADPTNVGAGKLWFKPSTGALKFRNAANTAWDAVATGSFTPPTGTGYVHITAGTMDAASKTATQTTADLDLATTSLKGLLPAGSGNASQYLNGSLGWTVPAGGSGAVYYAQSADPGAVGAGTLWIDKSIGPPYRSKVRNAGNSAWDNVGSVVGGINGQDIFSPIPVNVGGAGRNLAFDGPGWLRMDSVGGTQSARELTLADMPAGIGGGSSGFSRATFQHFQDWGAAPGNGPETLYATGDAAVAAVDSPPGSAGVAEFRIGTGAGNQSSVGGANSLRINGGVITYENRLYLPQLPSAGENYTIDVGMADGIVSPQAYNSILWRFDRALSATNWVASCSTSAGIANAVTNIAATYGDSAFHRLGIVVNAAGTALQFFYDGVEVTGTGYPLTTRIPTGLVVGNVNIALRVAGTTARTAFQQDYFTASQAVTR